MGLLTTTLNLAKELAGLSVEQLVKKGYPEEVAQKIASGELPMDPSSIAARQDQMGMLDERLYRGHGADGISSDADWWASNSPPVAETYQKNLQSMYNEMLDDDVYEFTSVLTELDEPTQDQIRGVLDDYDHLGSLADNQDFINAATDYSYATEPFMEMETLESAAAEQALRRVIKEANPLAAELTPIRTNASNLAEVNARGKNWRTVETNSNKLKGLQNAESSRGVHKGTDQIAEAVKDSEAYDGVVFRNIDDQALDIPKEQRGDSYNILASRPDVKIRHADLAAYDPEYTGGNIMGGLLAGGVGLGALSQSGESEAAGATSLIKLIRKQFGDDIDGATQELVRMGGYPESVARRIATGELPMDAESVAMRAQEQGYGSVLYHGGSSDINALDDRFQGMTNMESEGTGLWMSDEPDVANSYSGDEDYFGGALYPLRVKSSNPATIDAKGSNWGEIYAEDGMNVGGLLLELDPGPYDSNRLAKVAKEAGADSITFQNMSDVGPYYYGYDKASAPSNVVASLGIDKVRSPNAAFDPQYTGPNIMGGALAGAVGLGALSQSEDADAGPLKLAAGLTPDLAARQLKNRLNKERQKGISPGNTATDFIHNNTNYDNGFLSTIKKSGEEYGGPSYTSGVKEFAQELWQGTDDPMVRSAISEWAKPRLQRGAAGAGLLSVGANAEEQPRSAAEAGFAPWPEYKDPNAPLPVPTGWDILDSVTNVLGIPMSGLQGIARGLYGLSTGEDLVTAGSNAAHMMGSEWKNGGNIMTPGWDTGEGWSRYGDFTEKTFREAGTPRRVAKAIGLLNEWAPQFLFPF